MNPGKLIGMIQSFGAGPGTGNFSFFWCYRNRYWKNLVPEKVSEPVSVEFGIGKKLQKQYRKKLVPKKVLISVLKLFVTRKSIGVV